MSDRLNAALAAFLFQFFYSTVFFEADRMHCILTVRSRFPLQPGILNRKVAKARCFSLWLSVFAVMVFAAIGASLTGLHFIGSVPADA
jgi:hypothetical protein